MNALTSSPQAAISPNAGEILDHLNLLRKHALSLKAYYPDVPDDTVIGVVILPTEGKGTPWGISFSITEEIMEANPRLQSLLVTARNPFWTVYVRGCTGPAGKCPSRWEAKDADMLLGVVIDRDGGHKAKFGKPHLLDPSYRVQTSTGSAHDWYLLDSAITTEQFMRIAASVKALDADAPPSVQHLYRMIGTVNWPSPSKVKIGRAPEVVKLLSRGVSYTATALVEAADKILAQPISQRAAAKVRAPRGGGKRAPVDRTKLLNALHCIPADGYHDWLAVGMALKFEFGPDGLPIWDAWSEQAHNYPGLLALKDKWNSFLEKTDKPVTAGTIFKLARDHGWVGYREAAGDFADEDGGGKRRGTINLAAVVALVETDERFASLLAYNEFTGREDVLRLLPSSEEGVGLPNEPFKPRPITDHDQLELKLVVQRTQGYAKARTEDVNGALTILARRNRYNPVQDYLNSLAWDGVPRISDHLLDLGAEAINEPGSPTAIAYVRAVTRSFAIAAVARILDPGCQVDTTLVLEGFQGLGKSTLIRELMPDPDWFTDNLPKDLGTKEAEAHLQGKWLVEMAEVSALKKSDAETTKAFLSKRVERFRPVYLRHEISWPRTCVFVGSTNRNDYLIDESGNRRFLPLHLTKAIPKGTVAAMRDQFWAEAVAAYQAGEKWWFDGKILEAAKGEQAARLATDPWDDELPTVLEAMRKVHEIPTVANILRRMGVGLKDQNRGHQNRVASSLKRLGLENRRQRIAGGTPRYWWHPEHGDEPKDIWETMAIAPLPILRT